MIETISAIMVIGSLVSFCILASYVIAYMITKH